MCTIRCFEESVKRDFLNGEIPGFVHLYIGEEAIGTGICAALRDTDLIESTHRGHGHCIAKGADVATVKGLLGHSQVSTTLDIYTHSFDKNKKAASKTLQKGLAI